MAESDTSSARRRGERTDGAKPRDEMVSLGAACRMLGVSHNTLRRWDRRGLISTERTPGGQRRFPVAEIQRLLRQRAQSARDDRPVKMGPIAPPRESLPGSARALAAAKARIVAFGDAFYQWNEVPRGFFASAEGTRAIEDVLDFLERDMRRGEFHHSIRVTRELCSAAVRSGVRIVECFRFWELLVDAILAAVAPSIRGSHEERSTRGVLRSLTHHFLDEVDNPSNMIGHGEVPNLP